MPVHKPNPTPLLFERNAKEIIARLGPDSSPEAQELRKEANELIALFRDWMILRPSDPIRHDAVNRLFALHRRAMNYFLKRR